MYLLNLITSTLTSVLPPGLQRYAKAFYPVLGTVFASAVLYIDSGSFDTATIATALTGALGSLVTLLIPNAKPTS